MNNFIKMIACCMGLLAHISVADVSGVRPSMQHSNLDQVSVSSQAVVVNAASRQDMTIRDRGERADKKAGGIASGSDDWSVPEPALAALLGIGLAAVAAAVRLERKRRRKDRDIGL